MTIPVSAKNNTERITRGIPNIYCDSNKARVKRTTYVMTPQELELLKIKFEKQSVLNNSTPDEMELLKKAFENQSPFNYN